MVADTRHALGLISETDVDLLIHVGINTVAMQGDGFETFVKSGQRVHKGQKLMKFNLALIGEKGFCADTAVIVTNSNDFKDIFSDGGRIVRAAEDEIINIIQ
ncbi:PTS sugar transporter subunit IIA [Novisyntrophococcus fermenticellae]|uniref:PTS sugar transporter subunit IIA n=1 Tax=Novisyntrophococcus fermenticellae TaxID=2068655 RepID=UPI001E3A7706|nr:PTS glucose transporter subunit IIA [Novisyntrophococcus fermenticellae]